MDKKTPIETLCILITDNIEYNYIHNFQQCILTLKKTINVWKQRKLLLKGKITLLNHLALAPLIYRYVASVVDTPKRAIQEIINATQNFIWDGNTSKIAQQNQFKMVA